MDYYYLAGQHIKHYTIIKMLGEGRYGIVYLAEDRNSNHYIIKQLKEDMLEGTKEKLFYEQELLDTLHSPYFPHFIDYFQITSTPFYVLEYMEGRVFEDLLFKDAYRFTKSEIYKIASQLMEILSILHQHNILHRDIRPPNVILRPNNSLALIDFGLARYINTTRYIKEVDYWYLGDFLIHLYYSSFYKPSGIGEKPWFEELELTSAELDFLRKLMGLDTPFRNDEAIKETLYTLRHTNAAHT